MHVGHAHRGTPEAPVAPSLPPSRPYPMTRHAFILLIILIASSTVWAEPLKLPPILSAEKLQRVVDEAHAKFKDDRTGKNADYIAYLASVPSDLFGVAISTADGKVYTAGDVGYGFSIQSISKPFTAALVMQESGSDTIVEKIGVEPTGLRFNSVLAIEQLKARSANPLVNAGAMAAVSLVKGKTAEEKWNKLFTYYGRLAGEKLPFNEEVYRSESASNERNKAIANLLFAYGRLYADPLETCDIYTKQCSVNVTARQLAIMGATLANGGVNPATKERCLDAKDVPKLLAVMMTAGFYDESGRWSWETGVPAKTGVGGGILAVVPGRLAIVGFSPPLNESGNSIRSAKAIAYIVDQLELNLFGNGK
jgi:glutaminase